MRWSVCEVFELARDALVHYGADPGNAIPVAESIRDAERDGIRNVGLGFLPVYCEHLRCGKVDGIARARVAASGPGTLGVDGNHGFCHSAFVAAEEPFAAMVSTQGIAVMALARSYTAGVLGWFVERLALRGYLALGFANASPAMAPWGGSRPFFGTNPMAFATPRRQGPPLVIDQSSSMTAMVNVMQAARRGDSVPDTWVLDENGRPTTDPVRGLAGSMAPIGGYKGAALALMVDLLAAGLSGASFSFRASSLLGNEGPPPGVGQCFIAIDPGRFSADYTARVETMLREMLSEPGVRLPGDRRLASRAIVDRDGVEVDAELVTTLRRYLP